MDSRENEKSASKSVKYGIGRFTNPDSIFDRIAEKLKRNIIKVLNFYGNNIYFPESSQLFPEAWRNFFAFLARNKIHFQLMRLTPYDDMPHLHAFSVSGSVDSSASDAKERTIWGHSFADNESEALSKAVGEALERYMLAAYRHKHFRKATIGDLENCGEKVLPIRELAGFADWQLEHFQNRIVRDSDEFYWAEGVELLSGRKALIPAQLVFWTYRAPAPSEPFLQERNTNGCAGHFTKEEAALAAICELIERDGFMIHWLNSLSPPHLDPTTIPDQEIKSKLAELHDCGFDAFVLDTGLDLGVPSFITILINKSSAGPRIALGGGAHPNALKAIQSSLDEAVFSLHFARKYPPREDQVLMPRDYVPFCVPFGKRERMNLWHLPEIVGRISFLLKGPVETYRELSSKYPLLSKSPREEIQSVFSKFRGKGPAYEIYAYYADQPVLKKINYHAARVIIPALVPLYLIETNAPLGARRIKEVPLKLGYKTPPVPNSWPHPFP